jgi:hypothetical protein
MFYFFGFEPESALIEMEKFAGYFGSLRRAIINPLGWRFEGKF